MDKFIHNALKYTWIIREFTDGKGNKEHKLNLWNPISLIVLIVFAAAAGVVEGVKTFFKFITITIKTSL